ncbi:hypothetical protein GCM10009080_10980 [Cupriavidus pauculus]
MWALDGVPRCTPGQKASAARLLVTICNSRATARAAIKSLIYKEVVRIARRGAPEFRKSGMVDSGNPDGIAPLAPLKSVARGIPMDTAAWSGVGAQGRGAVDSGFPGSVAARNDMADHV